MSKIGDLFVRLGLKKDEFSKGMKEAKRESSSFVDTLKSIGSKGKLAFAAVAAAITGVVAAVRNLAKQNQTLGDAWNRMSAGMAASWDTFKTAVASMDFSHLLRDMREANRLARDLYDAQDALGEIGTSYNISLAKQLKTINELKVQLRDANLSDEARLEAGKKLLAIYEKLESNPTRGLGNVSDKTLDQMAQKLGFQTKGVTDDVLKATRKEVEQFFIWLGTEAGESWNKAYAKASHNAYDMQFVDFQARQAGLSKNYQNMLKNYQSHVGEKDRLKMEQAVTAYYEQQAKYSGETMRIQTQMNTIRASNNRDAAGGGGGSTGDNDAAALERIKEGTMSQAELLQKRYDEQLAMLQKHGEDTTALTQKFQQDLVAAMSNKANEGDLLEKVLMPTELVQKHYDELLAIFNKYGLDTAALTSKFIGQMAEAQAQEEAEMQAEEDALNEWSNTWLEEFEKLNGLTTDPLQNELHELTERTMAEVEMQEKQLEKAKEMQAMFQDAVVTGFSDACQELMDQLFGLEEFNPGAVLKALLDPLCKMAITAGEIIMLEGIATVAAKDALLSFGWTGYGAIAAGAALMAAGAAASAGLAALAKNGGTATSSSTYQGGGGAASTQTIKTELEVVVTGRISGRDLVLSGQRTVSENNR